jgi:HEAT repeat protein
MLPVSDSYHGLRAVERGLERGLVAPEAALEEIANAARIAPTRADRVEAFRLLGALAGRAHDAPWDVAERAAFALLEAAREADSSAERVALLEAMGRGFRNLWLLPYVHARLSDDDVSVAAAAITAAGGLAFPALEEAIASGFLAPGAEPALRLAAIGALGRMGAESAAARLVPFVGRGGVESAAALTALMEIRSAAGAEAAIGALANDPTREVGVAAARYLAEIGHPEVLPTLRKLARHEDAELRVMAGLASRAFKAERANDADGRILSALTERDRAVRAALARRLRTLPVNDVLTQAGLLLGDDAEGIIEVVAEVRAPEVTRFLLALARDAALEVAVRARAAGSIEANEGWEQEALFELGTTAFPPEVRVAALQTLGAFASIGALLDRASGLAADPSPSVRGALLWAIQLAAHAERLPAERARVDALLRGAIADAEPGVRRRAAYVAGNLDAAALVPDLVGLARAEVDRADLRVAAFVGLGEIGSHARLPDLVHLWNREDDAAALGAASRALERALAAALRDTTEPRSAPPSLDRTRDRLRKLFASSDVAVRAAACRVAGLNPGAITHTQLADRADDADPRVREQAVIALGRLAGAEAERTLASSLDDADVAVQERACEALLSVGTSSAVARVIEYASRASDRAAAARIAARLALPQGEADGMLAPLAAALSRLRADDLAYERLLELKVAALEAAAPSRAGAPSPDEAIAEVFPTWRRLSAVRGFAPLAKSVRTAESLYASTQGGAEADHSAAIVLWMKALEGYVHAWLSPPLRALQDRPGALWEIADRLGASWGGYQRHLAPRWSDPVTVGPLTVEIPLRAAANALREYQERRLKHLDAPLSVTEWARLLLFFGADQAPFAENLLQVQGRGPEAAVRLSHALQVLAQVRNTVTHRQVAAEATLRAFRSAFYAAFEEATGMA